MTHSGERVVLVVSPHPDDLEIGMGGSVASLSRRGVRVVSVIACDGRRSPRSFACTDGEMVALRRDEALAAARALGIGPPIFLAHEEARSAESLERLASELREAILRERPQEIYLPHPEIDRHETHRAVARATLRAASEAARADPAAAAELWAYEVWTPFPAPDRLVDVSDAIEAKRLAIAAHASQTRDKAYGEGMLGLNRYRGVFADPHATGGAAYAEAFVRLRMS